MMRILEYGKTQLNPFRGVNADLYCSGRQTSWLWRSMLCQTKPLDETERLFAKFCYRVNNITIRLIVHGDWYVVMTALHGPLETINFNSKKRSNIKLLKVFQQ